MLESCDQVPSLASAMEKNAYDSNLPHPKPPSAHRYGTTPQGCLSEPAYSWSRIPAIPTTSASRTVGLEGFLICGCEPDLTGFIMNGCQTWIPALEKERQPLMVHPGWV